MGILPPSIAINIITYPQLMGANGRLDQEQKTGKAAANPVSINL
ncbi:hypothetical protein [Candidatus Albibeggiatoa sp. nov. BB20]